MQSNNEVSEAIQLIYLAGQMMLFGGDLILKTPGTVSKVIQGGKTMAEAVSLKKIQFKMMCQFKNPGIYESLSLKDMEKLTGGDYRILRIPIEKGMEHYEEEAVKFFDAMKVMKIPFAEMPDINIGDGCMEIAINPQDSAKLKSLLSEYNFPKGKAEDITMDEYMANAEAKSYRNFQKEAVENAEKVLGDAVQSEQKVAESFQRKPYRKVEAEELKKIFPKIDEPQFVEVTKSNVVHAGEKIMILKFPGFRSGEFFSVHRKDVSGGENDMVLSLTPGRTYKLHNKDGSVSRIIIGKKLAALMKAGPQMLIERPGNHGQERVVEKQR